MPDGIAGFVDNLTGEHSSRSDAEDQVSGIETRTGNDRCRKPFVLVIGRRDEASFCCLQSVLAGIDLELKTAIFGSDQRLNFLTIPGVSDEYSSSSERLSARCTHDGSCDPEIAVRGLHSLRGGILRGGDRGRMDQQQTGGENRKGSELQKVGHVYSLPETNCNRKRCVWP